MQQTLSAMGENEWYYQLQDGTTVNNQKEGCDVLKIGRNAFRNRVKSGKIKKVATNDKPKGYYERSNRY